MIQKVPINSITENPNNPRLIKDGKFQKLVKSIKEFPQMLELRPIVVNEQNIILGGNMRYRACIEAGLTQIPILKTSDLTEEQQLQFIIKDNVGFGEWDWDILANEWDVKLLDDWGLDMIKYDWENLDYIEENVDKPELKSNNTITISVPDELIDERDKIQDDIKTFLSNNYSGCEVK